MPLEPQLQLDLAIDRLQAPAGQVVVLVQMLAEHPFAEVRVRPRQIDDIALPGPERLSGGDPAERVAMRIHAAHSGGADHRSRPASVAATADLTLPKRTADHYPKG